MKAKNVSRAAKNIAEQSMGAFANGQKWAVATDITARKIDALVRRAVREAWKAGRAAERSGNDDDASVIRGRLFHKYGVPE